jgi:hypothetical protein
MRWGSSCWRAGARFLSIFAFLFSARAHSQEHATPSRSPIARERLDPASCAQLIEVFLTSRYFNAAKLKSNIKKDVDEVASLTWRSLEERPVSKYFPDRLPHENSNDPRSLSQMLNDNSLPKESFDDFYKDLKESVAYATRFHAQGDQKEFLAWLDAKKDSLFTRGIVSDLINQNYTVGRLRYELHMAFVLERAAKEKGFLTRYLVAPFKDQRARRWMTPVVAFVGGLSATLWQILKGSLTAGPAAGIVGAVVEPEVSQIRNKANQVGNQAYDYGSEHIAKIQEFFVGKNDINDAEEARKHLGSLIAEMDQLKMGDPVKLAVWWKQKEDDFFRDVVVLQKALPAHLRDGRNLLMDSQYKTPLNFAVQASTFKNEYNTAKLLYKNTEDRLATKKPSDPSYKKLQQELKQYERDMDAAHQRLAAALAVWKVNEMMYRELFKPQASEGIPSSRTKDYDDMVKLLRFDDYISEVEKELANHLRTLDIAIDEQEVLDRMVDAMPPEVKAQITNKKPAPTTRPAKP